MKQQRKGKLHRTLATSEKAATRLKKLLKEECSWYGYCTAEKKGCNVEKGARCKHFEAAILPLKLELAEEYRRIYGNAGVR